MKLTTSVLSVCLMICLMFIARPVAAENKSGSMTLSPFMGGYVFEGNQDLDNGATYGLGVGYNLDKHWAFEAVLNYIDTEFETTGRNADAYLYHLDTLYHFMPSGKLVPYVAAGAGDIIIDRESAHKDWDFAVNYGAGLKYFLNENVALRGDVRHVISFDRTHSNLLYTVGLTFFFGGEKDKKGSAGAPEEIKKEVVIIASEPKVEEKVMIASADAKIIILAFEDVHFDFDQSVLTTEAQTILKRNIVLLKNNPEAQVRIAGYTSANGTDEYNMKLSERRAKAVEEYLVKEGVISQERLNTIGYGETNPAEYESAPASLYSKEAKANMRVLFEIVVE